MRAHPLAARARARAERLGETRAPLWPDPQARRQQGLVGADRGAAPSARDARVDQRRVVERARLVGQRQQHVVELAALRLVHGHRPGGLVGRQAAGIERARPAARIAQPHDRLSVDEAADDTTSAD